MTHDPLCPLSRDDCWNADPPSVCCCDLIARVREDERGKCIAAINAIEPFHMQPLLYRIEEVDAALRALQENS
jgi:hypothetical protein